MKKQKKKSLQIVKRIVTLFLILAITSTQIEPSVFAASSDGQWASESLKEDAVTENESADATADSTGTSNTDESHTDESETEKKPETTENPAQNPGNTGTTDGSTQDPGNAGTTDGSTQDPGNTGTTDGSTQDPGNTGTTDGSTQDQDNTDNADKTEQDPETTVTEEQLTEEPDENLSAADAVLPVEISYYLPKFQELKIEAPEEYTDEEQQEEARAAVTDQAMADETTQKLLEQAENDAESDDADESAVDTQALTESVVSEEEYVSYTQMAVTGDTLAAPEVSLPDDVQLDPEADPEDTDPLIGWQVAKLAGIVLSYADGTKINEGDVIPADQINEVSATAADDGIALLAVTPNMSTAQLIALTQDMTVVQRVGEAGANGKWSILVQGGTNQTDTAGTVRHAYGTLANALDAIKADTSSTSFKITFLDDYTASSSDCNSLYNTSITNKPTIVFTGAVNYEESTSYKNWTTFSVPSSAVSSNMLKFNGFNAYFTHINVDWNGLSVYFNRYNTTFTDMEFVSPVTAIYGGSYNSASTTVDYKLVFDNVEMRKDAPVKQIFGGGQDASTGDIQLNISNCVIYGNVYASGGPYNGTLYTHTGMITVNMSDVSIHPFDTKNGSSDMLNPTNIHAVGGSFWGTYAKNVTGGIYLHVSGKYEADYGTWFSAGEKCKAKNLYYGFKNITNPLKFVGTYQYPGTDGTAVTRNVIVVENSSITNIFGYSNMTLKNCDVSKSNFGHIQYDSSYYNYWSVLPASRANPSTYKPDQTAEDGQTIISGSIIGSGGTIYGGTWNRQRYGTIILDDSNSKFIIYSGGKTNGSNVVQMKNLTVTNKSYKADIYLTIAAPTTEKDAVAMLSITDKNALQSSFSCLGYAKTSAGVGCFARQDTANNLIKMFTPATSQYSMFLYKGNSDTGTPLASKNSFADILEALRTQAAGTYTIKTIGGFTLTSKDQTAFNNASGFANKDLIIKTSGAVCGAGTNVNPSDDKTRWTRMYPHFNSLTWEGAEFRADFPEYAGNAKTEVKFYANGHSLKFKDCFFICPSDIIAGTYSSTETTNQSVKLEFVNCKGIRNVYSNFWDDKSLNDVEISITSSSGFTYAIDGARDPINIDPARWGTVDNLTINIEDCEANITPSYTSQKVNRAFTLNMNGDVKTHFSVPKNASGYASTVNLNGNITLTGDCKSYSGNSTAVNVKGNVKTQAGTNVYLNGINAINVDGGSLQLGDAATKAEGGISGSGTTIVSLKNKGKLNFAYAPQTESKRTIYKLATDTTDTELSIMYDYNGTSTAPAGRPLIVQNTMSLSSSSKKLRVSTSLMPKHTGTTEYPLIQFNSSSNAKLEQYTWIADQRYYLAKSSNKIVLLADTYAPMAYQLIATDVTLNSDNSETRSISLYIQDHVRNAIDKTGESIRDASDKAYPSGVQVYLSTQDVQLKDGTYGYVYDFSKGDIQLDGSKNSTYATTTWYTSGTCTDINGASFTASTTSPVLRVFIKPRTYKAYTNYFIYVRDVAGNWSKFLLDTRGPSMSSYGNVTSTRNNDGTFNYTFSNLKFEDVRQSTSYGTSDISDLSYVSNASKFIDTSRSISEVKYNTTGLDPWKKSGTNVSFDSSTGVCTLTNVKLTTDKLYIFAKDGYGNKSKYEFVPVTFDAQCGGEVPDGKLSNGARYFSTLRPIQGYLNSQMPDDPTLKNLSFKYWYKSTDTSKSDAYVDRRPVTEAVVYYPLWNYPTLTISNTVTGSAGNKSKIFTYTVQVASKSGSIYRGKDFSCTGSSISGVTPPSGGPTASNPTSGDLTFGLKHGQSITITLKDYYDSVYVVQTKESGYWTSYTTEGNVKYNSTATKQVAVDAVNRRFAFTNSNDKSQPVVYQSKIKEGTWSESEGNSYKRGINLYIRDLYGSGVDMTGESFTTEEKGIYPSNVGSIGHIYLSPQDAKLVNEKYDYVYNKNTDYLLSDVGSGIWEASTQTDINGNTIPAKTGYPILKYYFNSEKNIAFDQDTNYFIYVRDKTGTWTKFLLDTKGPVVKEQGTVTVTKQGSNYVYSIKNLKFEDEQIRPANGTSALSNAADEKFSYDANATTYNTAINSEVRYNTTGYDPFVSTASASQYKTATNNGDGTYTISNVSLTAGQKLYVFSQDAYGNVSAVQYVPVTFDATEGGAHKKTAFDDNTTIKSTLVRKGEKLTQIPDDPHFTKKTTQKFLNWYDSTDTTNKAKVDFTNYVANTGVTFYANYEMPGITITQSVAGDASNKNQEFKYTVRLVDANGNQLADNTEILCVGSVIEGSGATSPDIESLTVTGQYGEVTFKLKHGQVLKLLPGALKYKVAHINQEDSGYTCTYKVDGQETVENMWAYDISINEIERQVDFVNTKNIVVTGISDGLNSKTLPIVGLAATVVMLGASALMLKRRRRS